MTHLGHNLQRWVMAALLGCALAANGCLGGPHPEPPGRGGKPGADAEGGTAGRTADGGIVTSGGTGGFQGAAGTGGQADAGVPGHADGGHTCPEPADAGQDDACDPSLDEDAGTLAQ